MWWVPLALGGAFILGIIAGTITMGRMMERQHEQEYVHAQRQLALELLWWIEGARKAGTLDKILPETIKKWEDGHATY